VTRIDLALSELHAASHPLSVGPVYADMMTGFSSGLIFGLLHMIGPQNLGTLMTLSSATTRDTAFVVGASCGLGHSFGMVLVAIAILSVRSRVTINSEAWEYYGNYLIGASMILCALNFLMRETTFLVKHRDGSYSAQSCACHGAHQATQPQRPAESSLKSASASDGAKACHSAVSEQHERTMHHKHMDLLQLAWDGRNAGGALIGMLQGTCCPLVMVGVSFVATLPVPGIVVFLITFMAITALGTAFSAMLWAWATNAGICGGLSPTVAYRMSCCFTLTLGIGWVIANYFHILDKLNYAEAAERSNLDSFKHA